MDGWGLWTEQRQKSKAQTLGSRCGAELDGLLCTGQKTLAHTHHIWPPLGVASRVAVECGSPTRNHSGPFLPLRLAKPGERSLVKSPARWGGAAGGALFICQAAYLGLQVQWARMCWAPPATSAGGPVS